VRTGFQLMSQVNPDYFLKGLPKLRESLETQIIGEQISRTRGRIELAQFYNDYILAQDNPDIFLEMTQQTRDHFVRSAKKSRKDSMVKQRFVDILFWDSVVEEQDGISETEGMRGNGLGTILYVPRYSATYFGFPSPSLM